MCLYIFIYIHQTWFGYYGWWEKAETKCHCHCGNRVNCNSICFALHNQIWPFHRQHGKFTNQNHTPAPENKCLLQKQQIELQLGIISHPVTLLALYWLVYFIFIIWALSLSLSSDKLTRTGLSIWACLGILIYIYIFRWLKDCLSFFLYTTLLYEGNTLSESLSPK